MGTRWNCFVEAVLAGVCGLCFGAGIGKIGLPLHTPVLLCKNGV